MRTVQTLDTADAWHAVNVIRSALAATGKAAVIAVADPHGELIALLRLDGAPLPSILNAMNKAWTAAREGIPSKQLGVAARDPVDGFDMSYFGDRRYIGWGGGVPVIAEGQVLGAVGVSGLPEAEDIALAERGAQAILEQREER